MSAKVGSVYMDLELNDKGFDKTLQNKATGAENVMGGAMGKIAGFVAGAFAVGSIINFGKTAVQQAMSMQSAWTGLNSIVTGAGASFGQAQKFITEYTKDGLVAVNEAVTAYKNLLSRGYNTNQIEKTMIALKDSASFGRQASYGLGEAVMSATEGLKNENSILVDNAGVTKNVAKMWQDYAKAHGITVQQMTQAQKIQAEYNGILEETKFQTGDAAVYSQTLGGRVQTLKASFSGLITAIGQVVAPIGGLLIPVLNTAINAVTSFFKAIGGILKTFGISFPDVVSKASNGIKKVGGMAGKTADDIGATGKAAQKAAKEINKAFAGVDEINVLNTKQSSFSGGNGAGSGAGGSVDFNEVDSGITSTTAKASDMSDILKEKFLAIGEILKKIWDSAPVQAYVYFTKAQFNALVVFLKTMWKTISKNAIETWKDMSGNVSILIKNMSSFFTQYWIDSAETIKTWAPIITDNVSTLFSSIWKDAVDPYLQQITKIISDFFGILDKLWFDEGKRLLDAVGTFINLLVKNIQMIWDNVMAPIIKPFLEMFSNLWDKHLKGALESTIKFVMNLISTCIEIYDSALRPVIEFLYKIFKPAFDVTFGAIAGFIGSVVSAIADNCKFLINAFNGIVDFIGGVFSGNWERAWQGVKNIFKNIIYALAGFIKAPINFIIDTINGFIKGLNKVKIPDWVPGVGGKGINVPLIPRLAKGGYLEANNPRLAIVGDNKREGEIVTPESKIYDQVVKALQMYQGTTSKSNNEMNLNMTFFVKYEDGRTIIKKINKTQAEAGEILLEI